VELFAKQPFFSEEKCHLTGTFAEWARFSGSLGTSTKHWSLVYMSGSSFQVSFNPTIFEKGWEGASRPAGNISSMVVATKKYVRKSCSINSGCHGYHVTSFQSFKIYKIPSDFDELYLQKEKRCFNSVLYYES